MDLPEEAGTKQYGSFISLFRKDEVHCFVEFPLLCVKETFKTNLQTTNLHSSFFKANLVMQTHLFQMRWESPTEHMLKERKLNVLEKNGV